MMGENGADYIAENMSKGWIKLYRSMLENPIWIDNSERFDTRSAWIDLLLKANHKEKVIRRGVKWQTIKRGQVAVSYELLCRAWGCGDTRVRNILKLLEDGGMIKRESNNEGTIITIVNYDEYQQADILSGMEGGDRQQALENTAICGEHNTPQSPVNTGYNGNVQHTIHPNKQKTACNTPIYGDGNTAYNTPQSPVNTDYNGNVQQADNKQTTGKHQTDNKRPPTNKNVKNDKEVKNTLLWAGFEQFWDAYPQHDQMERARAIWNNLKPDEALQEKILKAVEKNKRNNPRWKETRYIPYAANWLKRKQWDDDICFSENRKSSYEGINRRDDEVSGFKEFIAAIENK